MGNGNSADIKRFASLFQGRRDAFGLMQRGSILTVRHPLSLLHYRLHLTGRRRLGIYPLLPNGSTSFLVLDFDGPDAERAARKVYDRAPHYGLPFAWEISKSRGIHLWLFFSETVSALDVRRIARGVLKDASVQAEIFPKQDDLPQNGLGNFIWLPLSGESVKGGRTLFVNPVFLKPYPDQWTYLAGIRRLLGQDVSEILRMMGFGLESLKERLPGKGNNGSLKIYQGDLLPCAQRMLEGVSAGCRDVSTFRLAIHFKSRGYTLEQAEEFLQTWNATRNSPPLEPGIITTKVRSAYNHGYTGYGCEDPLVIPFCEGSCLIKKKEFAGLMVAERGYDEKDNSNRKRQGRG
jgi:hypothetical protein